MEISNLQLLSKNDIPFDSAKVMIHTPTIKQIGVFGEDIFWLGCKFLNFSKNILKDQDKVRLEKLSDFEILMTMMRRQNTFELQKLAVIMVLTLLFPDYKIRFSSTAIQLQKQNENVKTINKENFDEFKSIISKIFCLSEMGLGGSQDYNPVGPMAEMLAKKFKERQAKLAKLKNSNEESKSLNLLSRYISILAVGLYKDINQLLEYSVFQLFDEYHRFIMREQSNIVFKIKLAGGKDVKEAQNWMKEIHSNNNNDF